MSYMCFDIDAACFQAVSLPGLEGVGHCTTHNSIKLPIIISHNTIIVEDLGLLCSVDCLSIHGYITTITIYLIKKRK